MPCRENHEHTPACHLYGFHDFRRAFAAENAASLAEPELQRRMRHQSYQTTLRYIAMADRMRETTQKLKVPKFLRAAE